jgi:DNA-binding response OmpR family regulator
MKGSILLVDSFRDERDMYAEYLRSIGLQVILATLPGQAFREALHSPPRAVVTRIQLPPSPLTGIDLTRRLKERVETGHIPVIIITSLIQQEYRAAAVDAGCDGYLLLPVSPEELAAEIRRVVAGRRPRLTMRRAASVTFVHKRKAG